MIQPDILIALKPLIDTFRDLGIEYYIGGSIASSNYGIARATLDVDLVADIKLQQIESLVNSLQEIFYIDKDMILEAMENQSSFNIIHLDTMIKLDIFILKNTLHDKQAFERRLLDTLDDETNYKFYLSSPEDVILNKLKWFHDGGEVSERQWNDILGVVKTQQNLLDKNYLEKWAKELQVIDLLNKAFLETER